MVKDKAVQAASVSQIWNYGRGFLIILGFSCLGFGIQRINPIPFPPPLVGMLLLWAAVQFRLVKVAWIEAAGGLLLRHMSLFFLPILLGAVRNLPHSPRLLAAIVLTIFGGTLLTLWVTHSLCERWMPEVKTAEGEAA